MAKDINFPRLKNICLSEFFSRQVGDVFYHNIVGECIVMGETPPPEFPPFVFRLL